MSWQQLAVTNPVPTIILGWFLADAAWRLFDAYATVWFWWKRRRAESQQ